MLNFQVEKTLTTMLVLFAAVFLISACDTSVNQTATPTTPIAMDNGGQKPTSAPTLIATPTSMPTSLPSATATQTSSPTLPPTNTPTPQPTATATTVPSATPDHRSDALTLSERYTGTTDSMSLQDYSFVVVGVDGYTRVVASVKGATLPAVGGTRAVYGLLDGSNKIGVLDLTSGKSTTYPALPDITFDTYSSAMDAAFSLDGKLILTAPYMKELYSLNLETKKVKVVPNTKNLHVAGQSVADSKFYASELTYSDSGDPGVTSGFDLSGNKEDFDLRSIGGYHQTGWVQLSADGKYLYYPAVDPKQPAPANSNLSWVPPTNLVVRYEIASGVVTIAAKAASGNSINGFDFSPDGSEVAYVEGVAQSISDNSVIERTIKRVALKSGSKPVDIATTSFYPYNFIWCGNTIYYEDSKSYGQSVIYAQSLLDNTVRQANGTLVGCSPPELRP